MLSSAYYEIFCKHEHHFSGDKSYFEQSASSLWIENTNNEKLIILLMRQILDDYKPKRTDVPKEGEARVLDECETEKTHGPERENAPDREDISKKNMVQ